MIAIFTFENVTYDEIKGQRPKYVFQNDVIVKNMLRFVNFYKAKETR